MNTLGKFLSNLPLFGKGSRDLKKLLIGGSLPFIRGVWYFVDPLSGNDSWAGDFDNPVQNIRAAYNLCTTSAGDGICFLSRASNTTSETTSYLGGSLLWTKHGITVVGICSPQGYNARARIGSIDRAYSATTQFSWTTTTITDSRAGFLTQGFKVGDAILATAAAGTAITVINKITAVTASTITLADVVTANATPGVSIISTHCVPLLVVTGKNNSFINLSFVQNGTTTADLGNVLASGVDNYFGNCYFNGGGNATQAAETGCYDLCLNTSENTFDDCIFGTNSTIRAGNNAHIVLGVTTTQIGQNFFNRCKVISYSATAGHAAIFITNAATLGGWIQFKECDFVNWNPGAATALTALVGGVDSNNMGLTFPGSTQVGWAIWVDTGWDSCYTNQPAAATAGGTMVVTG